MSPHPRDGIPVTAQTGGSPVPGPTGGIPVPGPTGGTPEPDPALLRAPESWLAWQLLH